MGNKSDQICCAQILLTYQLVDDLPAGSGSRGNQGFVPPCEETQEGWSAICVSSSASLPRRAS